MTDIVERLRTFGAWAEVSHRHALVNEAATEIERLRKHAEAMVGALNAMVRATPEHDEHCPIGLIHGCTCDLKPANDQARESLAAYRAEYPEEK